MEIEDERLWEMRVKYCGKCREKIMENKDEDYGK